jgi:hypothetical protein
MKFLKAFGWFWWDLVIGDDWRIAAYVVAVLAVVAIGAANAAQDTVLVVGGAVALMACFVFFVSREAKR